MFRSAMAAMIMAGLAATPAHAQGQPQTPSPNYPYQEVERPPAGEVVRDVIQNAVEAAAARAREERRRERERRERERLEWERQQAQIPPAYYPEPPVAVVPSLPEPSSPADPALNPEPKPALAQPTPTRRATQKPASTVAQAASRPVKPPAPETAPLPGAAPPPVVDTNPTVTAIGDSPPAPPVAKPLPPQPETKTCPDDSVVAISATCRPKQPPLNRWWPLALLGFGVAAAGGGWSVQQRRARLARTRAALSLKPRLDQQAGTSSTSPIKLAAPRVSIRTRLEYS